MEFFWEYLKSFGILPPSVEGGNSTHIEYFKSEILKKITPLTIRKGEILHKTGNYCRRFYFVRKGLIRVFYILDDKEITNQFVAENEWVTSVNSFFKDEPSHYTLQALEDSELWYFTKTDLEYLYAHFPEMNQFGRILITRYYVEQAERINALNFVPAQERYALFIKNNPHLLNRIPLGMLATYLGITQETLSRIRRNPRTF